MPKIIIQAGHQGRTTGATGAPGEQAFNKDVSDRVASKLREKGFEVKRVSADPSNAEIAGDWDLFLSVHYDADVYNDHGGFVDYPEPSTDGATGQSQRIAREIASVFFDQTGIKNVPSRSNKNTRFYYMWSKISSKTPCVIIECGVGNRKPKDYEPLNTNRELVANAITNGLLKAFNITGEPSMPELIQVEKKDWERVRKASELGDKLIQGLGTSDLFKGNIADKSDEQINEMISQRSEASIDTVKKGEYNKGKLEAIVSSSRQLSLPASITTVDQFVNAIKALIDEANSDDGQNGSVSIEPPKEILLKDGTRWVRNGLQYKNGQLKGNYQEIMPE